MLRSCTLLAVRRFGPHGDYNLSMQVKSLFDKSRAELTREEMKSGVADLQKSNNWQIGVRTLETLMLQCSKRSWLPECEMYAKELTSQRGQLTSNGYHFLLGAYAINGNIYKLKTTFKQFTDTKYALSPVLCNTILHGLSKYKSKIRHSVSQSDFERVRATIDKAAISIFKVMERCEITNTATCNIMMAFGTHRDVIRYVRKLGYSVTKPQALPTDTLAAYIRFQGYEGNTEILEEISGFSRGTPSITFALIAAFTDSNSPARALSLFCEHQQQIHPKSSAVSGNIILLLHIMSRCPKELSDEEKKLLFELHDNGVDDKLKPQLRMAMQRISNTDKSKEPIYVEM